jgi:ABC-type branched-subunit amino acid transport system substrate-binding protein
MILAVEEINARGGMLKQKLDLTLYDTQTNPGRPEHPPIRGNLI